MFLEGKFSRRSGSKDFFERMRNKIDSSKGWVSENFDHIRQNMKNTEIEELNSISSHIIDLKTKLANF
jgi:hypothetical protein